MDHISLIKPLEELVNFSRNKLEQYAEKIKPGLTWEDLLQAQDYPELEEDPEFKYLEGLCHGAEEALVVLRVTLKEKA